jgi:hypothetical protein
MATKTKKSPANKEYSRVLTIIELSAKYKANDAKLDKKWDEKLFWRNQKIFEKILKLLYSPKL